MANFLRVRLSTIDAEKEVHVQIKDYDLQYADVDSVLKSIRKIFTYSEHKIVSLTHKFITEEEYTQQN